MSPIGNDLVAAVGSQTPVIKLKIEELSITNNQNVEKLLEFLVEGGKIFLNNNINGVMLIQTCRQELLRNSLIVPFQPDKKRELLKLLGEFLFGFIPSDKQEEIIKAIAVQNNREVQVELDLTKINMKESKLFLPWEYMRCSVDLVKQYRQDYKDAIWLSEKTLLYRTIRDGNETGKAYPSMNVLLIDATSEQKFFNFFHPAQDDVEGNKTLKIFSDSTKAIDFTVLGQESGDSRAAYDNFTGTTVLNEFKIIHFIVDYFPAKDGEPCLSFFEFAGTSSETEDIRFGEKSIRDGDLRWLLSKNDLNESKTKVVILQEWSSKTKAKQVGASPSERNFENLETIAFLLSQNKIPSTIILPFQENFTEKEYLHPFYTHLASGYSIGRALRSLRESHIRKRCYILPIFYLNSDDFALINKEYAPPPAIPTGQKSSLVGHENTRPGPGPLGAEDTGPGPRPADFEDTGPGSGPEDFEVKFRSFVMQKMTTNVRLLMEKMTAKEKRETVPEGLN